MAKKQTAAQSTWGGTNGQNNLYNLASAYAALNPGWTPPGTPATPSTDQLAYASPVYAPQLAAQNTGLQDTYTGLGVSFDEHGVPQYGGGAYLQGAQNYGIDENGNPISQGDVRFNPFSQGELMKKAFDERKNATVNGYAAKGQLYSGAINNAQNADASNYAQSYNANVRNAQGYYGGLVAKAVAARDNNNINTTGIKGNALNDYTNAHANDPAPVLAANLGGGSGSSSTPGKFRRTLTLGGRIANKSGFVKPTLKGPFG